MSVFSPLFRSKRFTLILPWQTCFFRCQLALCGKHSTARWIFTRIFTAVYNQILIYTWVNWGVMERERKCPIFETAENAIRTRTLSIANLAFYRASHLPMIVLFVVHPAWVKLLVVPIVPPPPPLLCIVWTWMVRKARGEFYLTCGAGDLKECHDWREKLMHDRSKTYDQNRHRNQAWHGQLKDISRCGKNLE